MTDAVVVGSLDGVGVVSGAFDDSRVGAVPTSVEFVADLVHGVDELCSPSVRGKNPPGR